MEEHARDEEGGVLHRVLMGIRSFYDKSQPGLLAGQSPVRIDYF